MSPFVQNLFAQEELEGHSSDVLLLILGCLRWVLSALYKALDIVIPRPVAYLCFDIHAFFHAHIVCWNVSSFDPQWSHIIPLSQLDQACQCGERINEVIVSSWGVCEGDILEFGN
jgi:hypothetical protein